MAGKLYLCATPIGNLEDMTFRAIRILQEVDLIAAEDTRNSIRLLNHFDIHTPLTSYHEYNKIEKAYVLIEEMKKGKDIALITDAGTPGISTGRSTECRARRHPPRAKCRRIRYSSSCTSTSAVSTRRSERSSRRAVPNSSTATI